MTKFEELRAESKRSDTDAQTYRLRSANIMGSLLTGFVNYMDAPPEHVEFLPPEERESNTRYSTLGAATLQEDGWWAANVKLQISPFHAVIFQFRILVESERFTVRVGDSKRTYVIEDASDKAALMPIFDEAYALGLEYYTKGLERFIDLASKRGTRKIGFADE